MLFFSLSLFSSFTFTITMKRAKFVQVHLNILYVLFSHSPVMILIYASFFHSTNFIFLLSAFRRFIELGCALLSAHDFVHLNKMRQFLEANHSSIYICFTIQMFELFRIVLFFDTVNIWILWIEHAIHFKEGDDTRAFAFMLDSFPSFWYQFNKLSWRSYVFTRCSWFQCCTLLYGMNTKHWMGMSSRTWFLLSTEDQSRWTDGPFK